MRTYILQSNFFLSRIKGLSIYRCTKNSWWKADFGKSVNFLRRMIPSPPLPLDGLAINVWPGYYLKWCSKSLTSSGSKKESGMNLYSTGKNLWSRLIITQKMFFLAKWSINGYLLNMHFLTLIMSKSWSLRAIPYHNMVPSPGWLVSLYPFLPMTYCMVSSSVLQWLVFTTICALLSLAYFSRFIIWLECMLLSVLWTYYYVWF